LGQQPLHICARTIPGNKTMNGEGMPQIMKPWLVASSVVPMDIRHPAKAPEGSLGKRSKYRSALARHEKGFDATEESPLTSLRFIGRKRTGKVSSNGYQPRSVKLAFADGQKFFVQVHVLRSQTQGFADA
jgi:hypothetical protein